MSLGDFVDRFVDALNSSRMPEIHDSIAPDVRAYITNAAGGVDVVEGKEAFLTRFPDFASMAESFTATVTQIAEISDDDVMFMVRIDASGNGKELHNFAAILLRLRDGMMAEYRMVEALPAYSEEFWAAQGETDGSGSGSAAR